MYKFIIYLLIISITFSVPLSALAWGFGGRIISAHWHVCILTITVFGFTIPIPIPVRLMQVGDPTPIRKPPPSGSSDVEGMIFPFISTIYLYYQIRVGPWGLGAYIYPFPPPFFNTIIGFFGANLWCPSDILIRKVGTSLI